MRRTLAAAAAAAAALISMLPGAAPAGARVLSAPGVYGGVGHAALAIDNLRIGKQLYMYAAGGFGGLTAEGKTYQRGFATRGKCFEFKKKHFKVTICMASGHSQKIGQDDFTFDPALQAAQLSMKGSEGRTNVEWTGRGKPSPEPGIAADPEFGALVDASVYRGARAHGTILGRRLAFKGFDAWSFLEEGADVFVINHARVQLWHSADGLVHVRAVKRVRI